MKDCEIGEIYEVSNVLGSLSLKNNIIFINVGSILLLLDHKNAKDENFLDITFLYIERNIVVNASIHKLFLSGKNGYFKSHGC
jgi:hypothetical protein